MGPADDLRRLLPDAVAVFFHMRSLRPAQSAAIPPIVKGRSVLLCAPTASGKTEAVVAPLYQRHVSFRRQATSVVYVAPTKALVNDVCERLKSYFATRGMISAVARYTGDHHEFNFQNGNFVLVTTPEALDSLQLVRPETLTTVRCVVIDEVHLLHGQPRGQQLRHVIGRIKAATVPPADARDVFQLVGMSATVEDLDGVRRIWLGEVSELVQVGGGRELQATLSPVAAGAEGQFLADWLERADLAKALVFCNRRKTAHALALELYRRLEAKRWSVFLHMGPLSPEERVQVETEFKAARNAICVSTSTLEVGMDIGDINAVALIEPPSTVGSLLQRAGRAGRRTDASRLLGLYRDEAERHGFEALLDMASIGEFDEVHEYDRPSVRFQQVMSLAWRATRLDHSLTLRKLKEMTAEPDHITVAEDMLASGALRSIKGALVPSDDWMESGDRRRLHTVILGSPGTRVKSAVTGARMASAPAGTAPGIVFLGGATYVLEEEPRGDLIATPTRGKVGPAAEFAASRSKLRPSRGLLRRMALREGRDPNDWVWTVSGVQTMGGYDYNLLLASLLEHQFGWTEVLAEDAWVKACKAPGPVPIKELALAARRDGAFPHLGALGGKLVQPSAFLKHLGPAMRRREAEAAVPLEGFRGWLEDIAIANTKD